MTFLFITSSLDYTSQCTRPRGINPRCTNVLLTSYSRTHIHTKCKGQQWDNGGKDQEQP